jgi:LPS export ABC transporter protein LptC
MKRRAAVAAVGAFAAMLGGCSTGGKAAGDDLLASETGTPGFEAREAEIVETGADGAPRYRVSARTVTQDPASRVVRLDSVRMRVEDDAKGGWDIAALHGLMPPEADAIELRGDVNIRGLPYGGRAPLELRSDKVHYEFDSSVARSDTEVTIRYNGQQLSARGLEARLKEQRVRLESDVHGRFSP